MCKILLKSQADKNSKDKYGYTPLHTAAYNGHLESCRILLQNQVDKDSRNIDGGTPLHIAAFKGM